VRQAETHNVEQLNAALSREKIAYHDLQRRYSALEVHKSHNFANVNIGVGNSLHAGMVLHRCMRAQ
jgi:hypothetical protein